MDQRDAIQPRMKEAELALLDKYIPRGGNVLEFGCGGSTPYFFEHGASTVASVETDLAWLNLLVKNPVIRHFLAKKRWTPIHMDIGPTTQWGWPAGQNVEASWVLSHQICWENMPNPNFDLAFLDGRFRAACFCQTLLRCPNPALTFVIHDFWIRPKYHVVLEFADILDRADTTVVLRPRPDPDWKKLALTLQRVQFDPT